MLALAAVLLLASTEGAFARDIFVDSLLGNDTGAGSLASPFRSVTKGMSVAAEGDTVHVAPGSYSTTATAEAFPISMRSGVVLQGAGATDTVLTGNGAVPTIVADRLPSPVRIDGFTITGGRGILPALGGGIDARESDVTITNNNITGNSTEFYGGGVSVRACEAWISGNVVAANEAGFHGGGIYSELSTATIADNTIRDNSAGFNGGGIHTWWGSPDVRGNIIAGNTANGGGGIHTGWGTPKLTDNTISGNYGDVWGGGIHSYGGASEISSNTVSGNRTGRFGSGAGLYLYVGSPVVVNNTIWGNTGAYRGGGIYSYTCTPTITNDTIVANEASSGAGVYSTNSTPTVTNCIVWGNGDDLSGCSATYSDIEDGDGGVGNVFAPPHFAATSTADFRPRWGSPCIDTGSASAPAVPAADRAGVLRPYDGDGNGISLPDMGSYEFVYTAPVSAEDSAFVSEDDTLAVPAPGVLGNDGIGFSAILVSSPSHGTLTLSSDGSYMYRPGRDFHGSDSFRYQASDGVTLSAPVAVTITVTPVNDPPVAGDDSAQVAEGTTLTVPGTGVLANDTDVDGDTLSAVLSKGPSHGLLSLSGDGSYTFVPAADFVGEDLFEYRAYDGVAYSASATVKLSATAGPVVLERWQGPNRFATAARVSERTFPEGADCVVIATGRTFPDALAGAPLAYATGSPVLLVERDSIPASTVAEIERLRPKRAYILGSESAVDEGVRSAVMSLIGTTSPEALVRIGGADRYETARLVALELARVRAEDGRSAEATRAFVAVGTAFPDALSVAGLAARKGCPILLTRATALPDATARVLRELECTHTIVVGGTAAIDATVYAAVNGEMRLGGASRWETCRRIAEYATEETFAKKWAFVATGLDFPDALAAGPAAAALGAPVLIVADSLRDPSRACVRSYFIENRTSIRRVHVIGSERAVSANTEDEIMEPLQGLGPPGYH